MSKRRSFSVKKKLEIIKQLEDGHETFETAWEKYQINKKNLGKWKNNLEDLKGKVSISPSIFKKKSLKGAKHTR